MICPECGGPVEIMVDVTILAPAEMEGQFSKKNLRSKDVKIYAVNWPKASYFCKKCRWQMLPQRSTGETL